MTDIARDTIPSVDGASSGALAGAWDAVWRHWLLAANLVVAVFVGLPLLAPTLMAYGYADAANAIYTAYHSVCHQWAFRSYFLFGAEWTYAASDLEALRGPDAAYTLLGSPTLGYKLAFCQRDVAIYAAVFVAGLAYAVRRGQARGLSLTAYAFLILPMALDGVSQLLGWRESSVELRTLTGALFGAASVWLIYPRVDAARAPAERAALRALVPDASRP